MHGTIANYVIFSLLISTKVCNFLSMKVKYVTSRFTLHNSMKH